MVRLTDDNIVALDFAKAVSKVVKEAVDVELMGSLAGLQ